ncbi:MAG: hypothetical protein ABI296_06395 [Gammaproteobacteria bacterium]
MFHQIQHAINPIISLNEVISRWNEIRQALAESSRKRKPQIRSYGFSLG